MAGNSKLAVDSVAILVLLIRPVAEEPLVLVFRTYGPEDSERTGTDGCVHSRGCCSLDKIG
jgi:hypothetical protein